MIRVCALEFLNRDSFESDVKLADGTIVISAGESVTPELILKLYFKEIYIDSPLSDFIPNATKVSDLTDSDSANISDLTGGILSAADEMRNNASTKGPVQAQLDLSENSMAGGVGGQGNAKGIDPQAPDIASKFLDGSSDGGENSSAAVKGPVAAGLDLGPGMEGFASGSSDNTTSGSGDIPPQVSSISLKKYMDEEKLKDPLVYDEKIAEEIKTNSAMLAKELKLSPVEIEDLEKAAMATLLGIDSFIHEDLFKRDFEFNKANAAYDAALKKGIYSNFVLEIIKNHAKPYVTEIFNLSPKISLTDILHITTVYSKYIYIGLPKEDALLKMLEYGGNSFNIFALHKFLRLMRENG